MRLSVRLAGCLALLLLAAPGVLAGGAQGSDDPLEIRVPPNARVVFELDAGDDDLLGVFKSFLKGFSGDKMKRALQAVGVPGMPGAPPPGAPPPPDGGMPPMPGMPPGAPGGPERVGPDLSFLADIDPSLMFKDIHRFHIVAMKPPDGSKAQDLIQFYEQPFRTAGGRRLVWVDGEDDLKFLMVGFPQTRGWAAVVADSDMLMVARADGYPNLESIGPLVMAGFGMFTRMMESFGSGDDMPSPPGLEDFDFDPPTPKPKVTPKPKTPAPKRPAPKRPTTRPRR